MNKSKRIGRMVLCLIVSFVMIMTLIPRLPASMAFADVGQTPPHYKQLTDNHDGTYTLSLDVTGDADTNVEANKANVVIVLDLSGSMDYAANTSGRTTAGNNQIGHYGNVAGYGQTADYRRLYYRTGSSGNYVYYPEGSGPDANTRHSTVYVSYRLNDQGNVQWDQYNGTRYNYTNNASRLEQTQTAVNNCIDTLLAQNGGKYSDMIEISLVTFSTRAHYVTPSTASANGWVSGTDGTNLKTTVSTSYADGATNWDEALYYAKQMADAKNDGDKTYVVFFSDGEPTQHNGSASSATNHNHNNNVSGGGSSAEAADYNAAYYEGRQLYGDDYDLFGIYAYGPTNGQGYMRNLVSYGNFGNNTQASGNVGGYYFQAQNQDEINAAFSAIASAISSAVGIAEVEIVDGTTNKVATSTGVTELLEIDEDSYKYWMSWQMPQGSNKITMFIDGAEREYTVNQSGENINISWDGGSATYKGTITGNVVKIQWEEATGFYNYDPPEAELNDTTGAVDWNLDPVGALLDGVTYTVTFDVYPSQTALDYKARLQNGEKYTDVVPAEARQYFDANGNLETNTTATLYYDDTRDEAGRQESSFTNPPAVQTQSSTMTISKEWEGEDADVDSLDMTVMMGDTVFNTVTLEKEPEEGEPWTATSYISVGIIKNGRVLSGSEGHDFSFAELDGSQYHWELDAPTVRPMRIGDDIVMLVKVDSKHPAPSGATKYTIDGAEYYLDEQLAGLTATNHRRSNLNLTKVVTGEDAPADAEFPFTVVINNSKAPATAPTDDPEHNSDYWIWFSIRGEGADEATVTGATKSGNSYYAPNGSEITINMRDGWNVRFFNLPSGTTYTFDEELAENFAFVSSELTAGTDKTFSGAQTTTGTIENTKTSYQVEYTNDYALTDLEITKVWEDENNQDGIRLTPAQLKEKLTLSPAVQGKEPTVVDNEDGTYTITYTGLPRYNNGQEVEYTVTESDIDGYSTTGSPAKDHGTITNTHVPEETEVTVVKVWDDSDNIGKIRPASINVQLKADGEASGDAVALNEGNKWTYTWEELPKYKDGEKIDYTADETAVPSGYDKKVEKSTADDGTVTFTVTNTYNPTPVSVDPPVQKVITNNDNLYNKGNFTFTIEATSPADAPMPTKTSITNVAANELEGKTGYYEFGEITFTMPGTYTYKITESGKVDGVTNDPDAAKGKTITFTVTDDGTGNLVVSPTTDQVQLSFTNVYDADGEASIVVNKAISGAAWPAGKTLTLTIDGTGNAPMPESKTATLDAAGSVTFGPIEYGLDDAGKEYTYTITEDGFGAGWSGSPASVTAKVKVTDNGNGTLATEVTYDPTNATFTNTYKATGKATLEATKAIEGADWPEGETITFTLEGTQSAPMPAEAGRTATLTEAGTATFGEITYTEADAGKTYTYTISEDGFGDGWTGSGDITATVEVTDNGNGTLTANVTYDPENKTIKNTYEAEGEAVLKAKKALVGRDWQEDEEYTFTLTAKTQGAPMPAEAGRTVTFDADGEKSFGAIEYDESDAGKTYQYIISETSTLPDGITKSADITATVVVTDKGNGELETTITYDPTSDTITNTYEAEGEAVLKAKKALVGRDWQEDEEYTFTLTAKTQGAPLPAEAGRTVTFDADGEKSFGTIKYTQEDMKGEDGKFLTEKTYKYTISETSTLPSGIEKSGDITATVVLKDDGNGNITATVTYDPDSDTIINTYTAEGSATLKAKKLLKGRDWMDNESYTFTLKDPNGTLVEEKTVTADGEITFAAINYDESDAGKTYTYTITETGNSSANVTASDPIQAKVEVIDNGDGTLKTSVTYTPEDDTIINTYVPTPVNAQINVNKTIDGYVSSDKGSSDNVFEFTLYDKDGKQVGDKITITTKEGTGTASFAPIQYTEVGEYTYTVKETLGSAAGYTYSTIEYPVVVTVTDDPVNGKLDASVSYGDYTVTSGDETLLDVINEFDMTDVDVTLTLTKTIDDQSNSAPDGTFTFKLYKDSVSEENFVEEKTITTKGLTGSVDFSELTFDKSGEYTYVVVEEAGDVNGFSYDTTEHTYKIIIDDNFDAAILEVNEDSTLEAEITNVYKAKETSNILKVKKEINDTSGSAYETTFTFTLKDADGNKIDEVTVVGAEEGEFKAIEYDKAGTYEYTITEVAGDDKGYQYDTAEYKVTVTVEDKNGELVATSAYIDKTGESQTSLTVTNTYDPEDAKIVIQAEKKVDDKTGGAAENPKTFTFELLDADGNVIETVSRVGGGTVTFSELTYSKVGEYNYTVREVAGDDKGYTYDTSEYPVTVTVTDPDKDGILKAAITVGDSVEFINPYEAAPTSAKIQVNKALAGRDLVEGEFTFKLEELVDGEAVEVGTATNTASGKVTFDKIKYTMPGDYTYVVSEVVPEDTKGVLFDEGTIKVVVKVTDDGNGQLAAEVQYPDDKTFNNQYAPEGTYTPEVKKVLKGRDLKKNEFTFKMVGPDGEVYTAKNDADGNVVFDELEFGVDDIGETYTYTITEKKGDLKYVTYDGHEVTLTLTITDNGDGTLKIKADYDGKTTFTNKYKKPTPPKTGDTTQVLPYMLMFTAALLGLILVFRRRKAVRK